MTESAVHERRVALGVTTVGILAATLNASILLISLPAIFAGLGLDPLAPSNISLLLWMLMGYMLATAVLVVTFGRLGDQYGRARLFNLGFAIFTAGSIACALIPSTGSAGAWELIGLRVFQGIGGAMLTANSTAIIADAFPADRRGFALGGQPGRRSGRVVPRADHRRTAVRMALACGVLGQRPGRPLGHLHGLPAPAGQAAGPLAAGHDRLVGQPDLRARTRSRCWSAITYGLQPYGGHTMGWTSPMVLGGLGLALLLLVSFVLVEIRVPDPMINMKLFRIRAFTAGNIVNLLASMARGGLQFILIIWLQGIWLPLHGYTFEQTPLWAGIYMLPLTVGFLVAGPVSGALSDRFGARAFATGGLLIQAASFLGLMLIPANFSYPMFALLLAVNGIGSGSDGRAELRRDHELGAAGPARRRLRRARHRDERRHGAVHGRLLLADGDRVGEFAALRHVQRADLAWACNRLPRRRSRRLRRWARCSRPSWARTRSNSSCRPSTRRSCSQAAARTWRP